MKAGLRKFWRTSGAICSLPFLYVLIYAILSLFGHYGPIADVSLHHLEVGSYWLPYGTFDPHTPTDNWTGVAGLVVKYETPRMAVLLNANDIPFVEAVNPELLEVYHAALVGRLVLLRLPSAQVSSSITFAKLGGA